MSQGLFGSFEGWSSRYEAQKTASAHSASHDRRGGRHVAAVTFTTTAMGRIAVISCPWEELGAGSSLVIINVTLLTFLGSLGPHLGVPSDLMSAFALPLETFSSRLEAHEQGFGLLHLRCPSWTLP